MKLNKLEPDLEPDPEPEPGKIILRLKPQESESEPDREKCS